MKTSPSIPSQKSQKRSETLQDYDTHTSVSHAEFAEAQKQFMRTYNANEVTLAGTVQEIEHIPGSVRKDRDGNPVLVEGIAQRYPDRYKIRIVFEGGLAEITPKSEWVNGVSPEQITEGNRYLFKGIQGMVKEYGNTHLGIMYTAFERVS
jgi:hypothetical protein